MASTCRRNHQASMNALCSPPPARPARWAVVLAFTLVYLAWGTTYLAISAGVKEFPPALFGGTRIGLAGLVLLGFLHWRGEALLLSRQGLFTAALIGNILFTGGNFLVTFGEKFVVSSSAAWQMAMGGAGQCLLGVALGEPERLRTEQFTPQAVYAFFHLLVFGSLVGFVAYNWLLG